jgi:hypothetical protein
MRTCHSGGAKGSDTIFENICELLGIMVRAYSYKTPYHVSKNKIEISDKDFNEGCEKIKKANLFLKRKPGKYINLLARNWAQVKYSDEIFAIGEIIPSGVFHKGYENLSTYSVVGGGTGWAVTMGILENKDIYVFDQVKNQWYTWSYIINDFKPYDNVKINFDNFAGIGTREINENGILAINNLLK